MRNKRPASTIAVARAAPPLASKFKLTVVVPPLGTIVPTVTHGWNEVAVTGQPAGVVTTMLGVPAVLG